MSVADVPRSDETLVLIAITFGGKLWNRCGIEPIGAELKSKQVGVRRRVVFRSINSLMGSVSRLQSVVCVKFSKSAMERGLTELRSKQHPFVRSKTTHPFVPTCRLAERRAQ